MKNKIIIFLLLITTFSTFSQEQQNLIELDSTWGKEIFTFPLSFAQDINYKGFEEARFPPKGWLDVNHPNFWSYTFAWKIDGKIKISAKDLETDMQNYFDGLMRINTTDELKNQKTTALFVKTSHYFFTGKIKTYDRFATKKMMVLHVTAKIHFCKKQQKTILLFKFSPKDFTHKTWKMLTEIRLTNKICIE